MDLQLSGKKALVTGGTKGIGRATVEMLAGEGASVSFCARTESDVKSAAREFEASGRQVFGESVDVRDGSALAGWVERSAAELGGVDIVVANVSALSIGPEEENWQSSFEVDLMHTVRTVNAAMPYLERSTSASIVAVSSVSGREVDFAAPAYGPMKAAIIHYAQSLAFQLAPKGIRANSVSPGNTFFEGGVWNQIKDGNRELYDEALALNPTGRMARPDEMAYAITVLASPRASFITGTNLVADGALTRGVQL
ncbi:SDR family NAD(P)-dependent oxidoreductase [Phytoactinopolyspora endophytica]|uniref:SDR family NAD(P)-dependent oxidoreductase n=1 Tax=Phytoactinopolyspora endophytica TaxID=1642495 RepID=UPI00101D5BAE|nr:SDR family oxidoreductase [Phytoactinopolyspora endophytica]